MPDVKDAAVVDGEHSDDDNPPPLVDITSPPGTPTGSIVNQL